MTDGVGFARPAHVEACALADGCSSSTPPDLSMIHFGLNFTGGGDMCRFSSRIPFATCSLVVVLLASITATPCSAQLVRADTTLPPEAQACIKRAQDLILNEKRHDEAIAELRKA